MNMDPNKCYLVLSCYMLTNTCKNIRILKYILFMTDDQKKCNDTNLGTLHNYSQVFSFFSVEVRALLLYQNKYKIVTGRQISLDHSGDIKFLQFSSYMFWGDK